MADYAHPESLVSTDSERYTHRWSTTCRSRHRLAFATDAVQVFLPAPTRILRDAEIDPAHLKI